MVETSSNRIGYFTASGTGLMVQIEGKMNHFVSKELYGSCNKITAQVTSKLVKNWFLDPMVGSPISHTKSTIKSKIPDIKHTF